MNDDKDYPVPPYAPVTIPYQQFCNEDHCTVEERAVIEAAIRRHEASLHDGKTCFEYDDTDLDKTILQLIAARSKSEIRK